MTANIFSVKENVPAFPPKVVKLLEITDPVERNRKIDDLWQQEMKGFDGHVQDSTKKLYTSYYRTALKEYAKEKAIQIPEDALDIIRLDQETMARINKEAKERRFNKNIHLIYIPKVLCDMHINLCRRLLTNDDPKLRALGIMGATGRRFFEIVNCGSFDFVEERIGNLTFKQRYFLKFSGQAKTRGAIGTKFNEEYIIPVLAPAKEIIDAYKFIRQSPEGKYWATLSYKELNSNLNKNMNALFLLYFKMPEPVYTSSTLRRSEERFTLSSLRPLYAEIAYSKFGQKTAKPIFFAKILGHKEDDYQSSLSYMKFTLSEGNQREEEIKKINELILECKAKEEEFEKSREDNSKI